MQHRSLTNTVPSMMGKIDAKAGRRRTSSGIISSSSCSMKEVPTRNNLSPKCTPSSVKLPVEVDLEYLSCSTTNGYILRPPSRRVLDPLLHRPQKRISDANHDFTPPMNVFRKRLSIKRKNPDAKSSISENLFELVPYESEFLGRPESPPKEHSSPRGCRISFHSDENIYQRRKSSFQKAEAQCCTMAFKNRCIVLQAVIFLMFGFALFRHADDRVRTAQEALQASHVEKSNILSQMDWLEKRAKRYLGAVGGTHDIVGEASSIVEKQSYQHKIDELSSEVQMLKATIQQSSRKQLRESFASASHSFMELELQLEGLKDPLVIQIAHEDAPYTAWTWLDQVRNETWNGSVLTPVGGNALELSSMNLEDEGDEGNKLLNLLHFREGKVQDGTEAFSVGVKNSHHHGAIGLILTIYMDEDACGQDEKEDEICFGKVVDGFKSLDKLDRRRESSVVLEAKVI